MDVMGIASGPEAIVFVVRRVVFVTMGDVCVTIYNVFGMLYVLYKINAILSVMIAQDLVTSFKPHKGDITHYEMELVTLHTKCVDLF